MAKALKRMLATQLQADLEGSNGMMVLDPGSMTVAAAQEFRTDLRENAGGARLRIIHNRTAKVAFRSLWFEDGNETLESMLEGPTGIVYGGESVIPAAKVVKLPASIDDQQAAALMLKGLTTQYLVRRCYPVQSGDTVLIQVIERGMPPIVKLEAVVFLGPVVGAGFHEGDAFRLAPLHLHHMGDGVLGPAVVRLQFDGVAAGFLGPAVVAALLQAEGIHAQEEAVAGVGGGPVGQGAGQAAAQIVLVAVIKVGQVADLKRQGVTRMVGQKAVVYRARAVPVALRPGLQGRGVAELAFVGTAGQPVQMSKACLDFGQDALFPKRGVYGGAEDVAHDEIGIDLQCRVKNLDRVAAIALQALEGGLEGLQAVNAGS